MRETRDQPAARPVGSDFRVRPEPESIRSALPSRCDVCPCKAGADEANLHVCRLAPFAKLALATSATQIPEARRGLIDTARQQWIRKLIDPSRRNNLLYFRQLKTGTLDLSGAIGDPLAAFFAGAAVPVSKLFAEEPDRLDGVVREIARRALSNLEEKGLQTLFVALGIATWPADDGGRVPESPILLLPVSLNPQGRGSRSFSMARTGPPQINLVLLHFLNTQFGVSIAQDDLLALLNGGDEPEPFDPQHLFSDLAKRCKDVKDFSIRTGCLSWQFRVPEDGYGERPAGTRHRTGST